MEPWTPQLSPKFVCIPLGVSGGMDESNLSSYLMASIGTSAFACLDAGTLYSGLRVACAKGAFEGLPIPGTEKFSTEGEILHNHIKAYLISHPYLDHTEGLVVMSPNDSPKPIMGIEGVLGDLREHLFNWRIWPNLASAGKEPAIGQYTYVQLDQGVATPIKDTPMRVRAFPLAHGIDTDSTAFLIEHDGEFILYMGDTGPDAIEKRTTTEDLWREIAPLIRARRLHGIFIETSYPDDRPDNMLYSHLTPRWLMDAFGVLAGHVDGSNPERALSGLNVVITHIKPDLFTGRNVTEVVREQLRQRNRLGLRLIFAEQGKPIEL